MLVAEYRSTRSAVCRLPIDSRGKLTITVLKSTAVNFRSQSIVHMKANLAGKIIPIAFKDGRFTMAVIKTQHISTIILAGTLFFTLSAAGLASTVEHRIIPGEKLTYELRWENIPAGEMQLEILPITSIGGTRAYHFVMTARSNSAIDFFIKIRDRIDAYADLGMTHSIYYQKGQTGESKRQEVIEFDWEERKALYTDTGRPHAPIELMPDSFGFSESQVKSRSLRTEG